MNRREFIRNTTLAASSLAVLPSRTWAADADFPVVRVAEAKRKFKSAAVERAIARVQSSIGNKELAWMFGNCFPNTLDTTVDFSVIDGRPDTYVITGDIDAMWLRDSSAQVWPYLPLMKEDPALQQLVAGVINRQTKCILKDPYANAFYKNEAQVGEWKSDLTDMKPGVHERKWEVDSLCYPIRLAYGYWEKSQDKSPFDDAWRRAVILILKTFREQQRKDGPGTYHFARTHGVSRAVAKYDFGKPVKPLRLIFSMFRPSDDYTTYPFLVPSNFFAVVSLRQAAEMLKSIYNDHDTSAQCRSLADEVEAALKKYAVVEHEKFGRIYAYEMDGLGNFSFVDDANVPDLLSLTYLGAVAPHDSIYLKTREFVLSSANPFYFKGVAAEGLGGPHSGPNMIWPMGVTMQALTSRDNGEIRACLKTLQKTHAGTGFMHESFNKDDPQRFSRPWFAWANTLFGELVLKTFHANPALLS